MKSHEELIAEGYKAYESEKLTVYWKPSLCTHATFCVRGDSEVFNVNRRPWVMLYDSKADDIVRIVESCPSKALLVRRMQ